MTLGTKEVSGRGIRTIEPNGISHIMIKRRFALCAFALFATLNLGLFGPSAGAGALDTASRHVEQIGQQVIALQQRQDIDPLERQAAMDDLLRRGLDIPAIARVVLGKAWRTASPEQRQQFVAAFDGYVLQTISRGLEKYGGTNMTTTGAKAAGSRDVLVHSRIEREGAEPIKAVWRVRERAGEPKIIDVTVEGISLVLSKREEFASVVRSRGLDALVQALQLKT